MLDRNHCFINHSKQVILKHVRKLQIQNILSVCLAQPDLCIACDLSKIVRCLSLSLSLFKKKKDIPQVRFAFVLVFIFECQICPPSTVCHNVNTALCKNHGILHLR